MYPEIRNILSQNSIRWDNCLYIIQDQGIQIVKDIVMIQKYQSIWMT